MSDSVNPSALGYGHTTSTQLSRATFRSQWPRVSIILPYVINKKVLDLGCGMGYQRPDGLHYQIAAVADEVLGIDVKSDIVNAYKDQGYNVQLGDVQEPVARHLSPGQFDVVTAGEIIEHLENFAGFFDNVRYHLKDDGYLILSTVNAFAFPFWIRVLFMPNYTSNLEHTCWFDKHTIVQLLARCGFNTERLEYIHHRGHWQFWNPLRILSRLIKVFLPDRVCWHDMVVFAKKAEM